MGVKVLLLGIASALVACDAPAPRCALTEFPQRDAYCRSATTLAVRDGAALHADQSEVDQIYATLVPAWRALPLTRLAETSPGPFLSLTEVDVWSTNPTVAAAWRAGQVATGDPAIDAVFAGNGVVAVEGGGDFPIFTLSLDEPTNMSAYAPLVASVPDTMFAPFQISPNGIDIALSWDGADQRALFSIGWEDCFSGCAFRHSLVVRLPGDGTTALIREYGDEIPDYVLAQADAIAPP